MIAVRNLMLATVALGLSSPLLAADVGTSQPITARLLVERDQISTTTRVEYCLRNMPELTEVLTLAHATYSQAATEAAAILERRFPSSKVAIQRARMGSPEATTEFALQQARSEGFYRLCPQLVASMHDATGESLAKKYGDTLESFQKQFPDSP